MKMPNMPKNKNQKIQNYYKHFTYNNVAPNTPKSKIKSF